MSQASLKLLLLEANPACKELLLADEFYAETADRLAVGLEKLGKHSFDLVVLDLALPDGHGMEAFHLVRAAAPHTPIVILAGPEDAETAVRAIALGAEDYLLKAKLTTAVLAETLHKTIGRHRFQLAHNHEGFLLRTLMENIPDAVYFKDTRSRFLMMSRALVKKHGLTDAHEAVGKTDADFFVGEHAMQALKDEQNIMRSGRPLEGIEESETWPDGSTTWVSTTKMPLRNQAGRIIGTFGISRDITKRKLAELTLAERSLQLQKKNAQVEEELKMARELQLAMLPHHFPCVSNVASGESNLKFFSFFIPSGAVSGDFFDVVPLSETSVGIFICDVMGHDVRAALVTAMLRSLVENFSLKRMDPGQLLAEINRALFNVFRQTETTMFATAFYLVADVATRQFTYASAAHPNPLQLKRLQGRIETLAPNGGGKKGPALGMFKEAVFPTYQRPMDDQDVIVLFTDGMIEEEGRDTEIFSQERLIETIQKFAGHSTREMLIRTLADIRQFSGQPNFSDDVCLIGIEVKDLHGRKSD